MKRRTEISQTVRVRDVSGGMVRKLDASKLETRFARDAKNLRFQTGAIETRPGTLRAAQITRPGGAITFPGDKAAYVEIKPNLSCPIWTGLGPEFTIEWIERPVDCPDTNERQLFEVGDGSAYQAFAIRQPAAHGRQRFFRFHEDGVGADYNVGFVTLDGAGTTPTDRRYYCRIRRRGRDVDSFVRGRSVGDQSGFHANLFASADSKLKSSAGISSMFIGGNLYGGSYNGLNAKIDALRIWGRYIEDTTQTMWTGHPMLEDPKLYIWLDFNEGSGSLVRDHSIWGNHGAVVGAPTRGTEIIEGMMVGQAVDEFTPPGKNHRIVVAGGSIFREVVE